MSQQIRDFLMSLMRVTNKVENNSLPTVRYQIPNEQPLTEPIIINRTSNKSQCKN